MKRIWLLLALLFGSVCAVQGRPHAKSSCRKPYPRIAFRVTKDNVVDLTYVFDNKSAFWPSNSAGFQLVELFKGFIFTPLKYFYSNNMFSQPEHLGTHFDAPIHFSEGGADASEVSLFNLIGPGVLINLKQDNQKFDKDGLVTVDHFREWERSKGGKIRSGSIILIHTGYGEVYYDRTEYYGTNLTGPNSVEYLHFPGLDPSAAEWLVTERCIAAVGLDTASIDNGQSKDFESHRILSKNGIPIFENVANLDKLVKYKRGFSVVALPQKIGGGSGGPLRIIAVAR